MIRIFKQGMERYGSREWSPNIIKRLEETCDTSILAPGFPAEIEVEEEETPGMEVVVSRGENGVT